MNTTMVYIHDFIFGRKMSFFIYTTPSEATLFDAKIINVTFFVHSLHYVSPIQYLSTLLN